MLPTLLCLAAVLLGSVALGAPVAWLLNGRRPLDEEDWLLAPGLGLCSVVVVLYNLVHLDLRVGVTAPFVWAACAGLWVWMVRRAPGEGLGRLRAMTAHFPWLAYLAALAVFAVPGVGVLRLGLDGYTGRSFTDHYNYTSLAQ